MPKEIHELERKIEKLEKRTEKLEAAMDKQLEINETLAESLATAIEILAL